jgi:transcriptional regulator with XRE-family HTH domain
MLRDLFSKDKEPLPNKFTRAMGDLIRKAREESRISQAELAEKIYRRQAAISDIERGRMEVSATTLMQLSFILNKPISYFFPQGWISDLPPEKLSQSEQELLIQVHRLDEDDIKRLTAQARAIADLSERESAEKILSQMQNKKG